MCWNQNGFLLNDKNVPLPYIFKSYPPLILIILRPRSLSQHCFPSCHSEGNSF